MDITGQGHKDAGVKSVNKHIQWREKTGRIVRRYAKVRSRRTIRELADEAWGKYSE